MKHETHENIDDEFNEDDLYKLDKRCLDEKELRNRVFERKLKNTYDIKRPNDMNYIDENEVNKINECNLLHDIMNTYKRNKRLNSHYSHIIRVCTNTQKGRSRFNTFRILLDGRFSSTVVMIRLIKKLILKKTM